MSEKDSLRRALLEENGLSEAGPADSTRHQIAERVLRDFDRARKSQSRAFTAWIVHALLFCILWGIDLREGLDKLTAFMNPSGDVQYPGLTAWGFQSDPQSLAELVPATVYWLNGMVFLYAVLATVLWLQKARVADASADLLYRFRN